MNQKETNKQTKQQTKSTTEVTTINDNENHLKNIYLLERNTINNVIDLSTISLEQ